MATHAARRIGTILLLGFVAVIHGRAVEEASDLWIHGIYTGKSPRPVVVEETEAWKQANRFAETKPGAFVLVGGGKSMQPLYAPGTILVMQECPYEKLERGQTALYRNRAGKAVAHVLITKARDGWRVAGLNNRTHDMEPVLAQNLVGVVIAAFRPSATSRTVQVASLLR